MTAADVAATGTPGEHDAPLEADGPLKVTLCGQEFTAKDKRPIGAFSVFCARVKTPDPVTQAGAPLMLLKAWIIPEDHNRLDTALESVEDLEEWMQGEFAQAMTELVDRPS